MMMMDRACTAISAGLLEGSHATQQKSLTESPEILISWNCIVQLPSEPRQKERSKSTLDTEQSLFISQVPAPKVLTFLICNSYTHLDTRAKTTETQNKSLQERINFLLDRDATSSGESCRRASKVMKELLRLANDF